MRSVAIRLHAQLAAFAFIFSLSPLYRINARNNYGHYHGLCRDKFTKTPRWGRVETAERLLLEFLRYINAFACQELCFSPSLSLSLCVYSIGDRIQAQDSTRLHSCWLAGYGTFDMRVFTNRTDPVVGKLHIPMYVRGPFSARMCPPVCIELSQFRAMDQTWFARYRIVRNASNSARLSSPVSQFPTNYTLATRFLCPSPFEHRLSF